MEVEVQVEEEVGGVVEEVAGGGGHRGGGGGRPRWRWRKRRREDVEEMRGDEEEGGEGERRSGGEGERRRGEEKWREKWRLLGSDPAGPVVSALRPVLPPHRNCLFYFLNFFDFAGKFLLFKITFFSFGILRI